MVSSNLKKSPLSIKYFVLCSPVTSINQGSFSIFKLFDTHSTLVYFTPCHDSNVNSEINYIIMKKHLSS